MSDSTHRLYKILAEIDVAKLYYTLDRTRDDTVMILVQVPGRHYEIEVFDDGKIEVEVYKSDGHIGGRELVDELLREFQE